MTLHLDYTIVASRNNAKVLTVSHAREAP